MMSLSHAVAATAGAALAVGLYKYLSSHAATVGPPCNGTSSIEVYYWGPHPGINFYGRGIGIYLTLNQAGVEYEKKPQQDLPANKAFAVPCVCIDGTFMGQTPAILTVLGQKFGLAGTTDHEKMAVLQAVEDLNDIFGEHKKFVEDEERKDKWFTYLEAKMEGKQWMGGTSSPTIADFHGVFAFE